MRANKFNVTFHAQDFDATKRFYQDVLELEYLHGWDDDSGRGAVFALTDLSELEFFGAPQGQKQTEAPPQHMNLALQVDDVDAEYERLRGKVTLVAEINDRPWGDRSFGFTDPEGIHIYLFQKIAVQENQ